MPKRTLRSDLTNVDPDNEKKSKTHTPTRRNKSQRNSPASLKRTPTPNKSSPTYDIREFFLTGKLSKSSQGSSPVSKEISSIELEDIEVVERTQTLDSVDTQELLEDTVDIEKDSENSGRSVDTPEPPTAREVDSQPANDKPPSPEPSPGIYLEVQPGVDNGEIGRENPEEIKITDSGRKEYYAEAFDNILDVVMSNEQSLFTQEELHIVSNYRNSDVAARYLFIRIFMRKTGWLRVSSINYSGIDSISESINVLCSTNPPLLETESRLESIEEASRCLNLDELRVLGKELSSTVKISSKKRDELIQAIIESAYQQSSLKLGFFSNTKERKLQRQGFVLKRILQATGGLVRIPADITEVFARIHLVYYRKTSFDEKAMVSTILAKIGRRNFPQYEVNRSYSVFKSRKQLLEYEQSLRLERTISELMHSKEQEDWKQALRLCETCIYPWELQLIEYLEHPPDADYYLLRFSPGWVYTRIMEYGVKLMAGLKDHDREKILLRKLLDQKIFRLGKRGLWYERLALVHANYTQNKREGLKKAHEVCLEAIHDDRLPFASTNAIYSRIMWAEKKLAIPKSERHDFSYATLQQATQVTVYGTRAPVTPEKTRALYVNQDGILCTVEAVALEYYEGLGFLGYHSESSIATTLFSMLFWDILFASKPGVFDTEYQTEPLDLHSDAFYVGRQQEIETRLTKILAGDYLHLIREVDEKERPRKTQCVGINWGYEIQDLLEIAECIGGRGLSAMCKVLAQEYKQRSSGLPDLCLWNYSERKMKFVEVKGPGDRLSETQKVWIDLLLANGVDVEHCLVRVKAN
ncbi:hypothetical protein K493DRAFT_295873 [Basidiobolus meristosporus CBS 931.73]|uniref:Fanconi-associated nuclease n=1 Tax=Basidiobolus meristosporus CBS 931.73 TaxID=1314790 RepID=A0A1Y1Z9E5_9FUNG|nr:hypothetical protein K493DRAFT_295873 [Basidiobolus meristosporus CBS 931.73]|eukprot:ORY06734.1 hypothetical protein K493DRAFT_295873 [Basidiobolus meristosporus CBS 931.73]